MVASPLDGAAELAEDARQLLAELERTVPGLAAVTAECRPPTDVLETAQTIEIVVDLPGVAQEHILVAVRRHTVLVVGAKIAAPTAPQSRFHVAERSYGRFARAVRLSAAIDATRAAATIEGGQLRIVLPRLEDRRGQLYRVPVTRR